MPKYIKTIRNEIIVFNEYKMHSDLKHLEPISAGFIEFYTINDNIKCRCYGESISLSLQSHKEDTNIAQKLFEK